MVWVWPLVTVAVVAIVVFLVTAEMASATRSTVERSFVCPRSGQEVTAVFATDFFEPRRHADVLACSRFAPAEAVGCAKDCLRLEKDVIAEQDALRLPVWIG